jgi:hypothetical protein
LASANGEIEWAVDQLARRVETGSSTNNSPSSSNGDTRPRAGDYRGAHGQLAGQVADGLWLSSSLWQREIGDGTDRYRYRSWSVAGLYRFNAVPAPGHPVPALALQLGPGAALRPRPKPAHWSRCRVRCSTAGPSTRRPTANCRPT